MRNLIVISILLCYFAASAESQDLKSNFTLVRNKINELRKLTGDTLEAVEDIARADNITVGNDFTERLEARATEALFIFSLIQAEVEPDHETLTQEKAVTYLATLVEILIAAEEDVQDDMIHLSPEAQDSIVIVFSTAYVKAEGIAQEIYKNLDGK